MRGFRRSTVQQEGRLAMPIVAIIGLLLLSLTTLIHYEVLRALTIGLPLLRIPARVKLIVVIFATFLAHLCEIGLYAVTIKLLVSDLGLGSLGDTTHFNLSVALYFSAETFSSLGYGDVVPGGALRLLAGGEALNGLLLVGWSASYIYIAMERFWNGAMPYREYSRPVESHRRPAQIHRRRSRKVL
jgi:hypothetical protein